MHASTALRSFVTALAAAVVLTACGSPGDHDADAAASSIGDRPPKPAQAESRGAAPETATAVDSEWGRPLARPELYYGLYAAPDKPDRQWFVTEAKRPPYAEQAPEVPKGHLAIGAMFGDVAPWNMKTLSATEFEQAQVSDFQPEPVSVTFELDGEGRASAMTFTNESYSSEGRLLRQGDLPPDWQ